MGLIYKPKVRMSSAFAMWFLFLVFTLLVKNFDVKAIGPSGSMVGFASINGIFANWFGYNELFYHISDYLGYLAILLDGVFALIALCQWISRKRMFAVDRNLLYLMFLYTFAVVFYVVFYFVVVNYRTVILPGEGGLESSYPSSHTMLAVVSYYTAVLNLPVLFKKSKLRKIAGLVFTVLGLLMIVGRILSGVHWITDIIGALIFTSGMVMTYLAALSGPAPSGHYTGKRVAK